MIPGIKLLPSNVFLANVIVPEMRHGYYLWGRSIKQSANDISLKGVPLNELTWT